MLRSHFSSYPFLAGSCVADIVAACLFSGWLCFGAGDSSLKAIIDRFVVKADLYFVGSRLWQNLCWDLGGLHYIDCKFGLLELKNKGQRSSEGLSIVI